MNCKVSRLLQFRQSEPLFIGWTVNGIRKGILPSLNEFWLCLIKEGLVEEAALISLLHVNAFARSNLLQWHLIFNIQKHLLSVFTWFDQVHIIRYRWFQIILQMYSTPQSWLSPAFWHWAVMYLHSRFLISNYVCVVKLYIRCLIILVHHALLLWTII